MIKRQDEKLSIYILKLIGIGALFTAASILSPTFLYVVLKKYLKYKLRKSYKPNQIKNSIYYLRKRKFIAYEGNNKNIKLTDLGKRRLSKIDYENLEIKTGNWDGKWRFLFFDIPEEKLGARDTFRRKLKLLGFFHFQRSVFVCPYPCEKEINFMTDYLDITPCVYLVTAKRFSGDEYLLKEFALN